jgi:hypothetical protein
MLGFCAVPKIPRDWLTAALLALAVVSLANLPYLLGYGLARPGTQFAGILLNPQDSDSYLAKMHQGYAGRWAYRIPFTSDDHPAAYLGGFYLALGHLARLCGMSVIAMWHAARAMVGWALCLVVYGFLGRWLPNTGTRRLAYVLALVGSGLGWVLLLVGQAEWLGALPVDFLMPEAHLFPTLMTFPHFSAGTLLIVASLQLAERAFETRRWRFWAAAGAANLALAVVYPYLIDLIALVLLFLFVQRGLAAGRPDWRGGGGALLSLLLTAPLFWHYARVLETNGVMRAWAAQAVTPSPHPLHYLLAYGAMLALACPTLGRREYALPWLWVLAVAFLVYAPLNPQRRFVEGVQVPLALLAAAGLADHWLPRRRARRLAATLVVAVLAASNAYLLVRLSAKTASEQPDPLFRYRDEIAAVDWAGAHLPAGSVLLAAYRTGSFIPSRTDLRTVVGHWAETPNFTERSKLLREFFSRPAEDAAWRTAYLADERVDYVFYGPHERALGDYDPGGETPPATRVFANDRVAIYRVRPAPGP